MKGHTQVYKLIEMFFHTFGQRTSLCVMDHGLDYHRDNQYYCQICAGSLEYSGRYFLTIFAKEWCPCQRVGTPVFCHVCCFNQSHTIRCATNILMSLAFKFLHLLSHECAFHGLPA